MTKPIKVFVSYSWGIEEETRIVDEIEKLCPPRGIKLIRDRNEIQHGELIENFMNDLSGSEHIITIFSKPYFKSKWCMFELLRIWQKGDFQERTYPVIADDIDLQNSSYRIDEVDHWQNKHQKLKTRLDGRDPSLYIEEYKQLNLLRDISQDVNNLMVFAAGRLTTPLDQLREENYAQILDQIRRIPSSFIAEIEMFIWIMLDQ